MKGQYYKFLIYRLLGLLMALNVIKLSSNVQNTVLLTNHTITVHEDWSGNSLASIGAFLVENGLGFSDAVPNQDGPDEESELTELEDDYDFNPLFVFDPIRAPIHYLVTGSLPFRPEFNPAYIREVFAPPPQILS